MTGRERLNAVLHKQPTDRLPWTTLVDNNCLSLFPEDLQGSGGIDFYRHLGCDIFLLNGWNTPHHFRSPELVWPDTVRISEKREGSRCTRNTETQKGTLTGIYERSHPVKYPVDSLEAVRIYRHMWEGASFVAHDDSGSLSAIDALIGDDGITTRFWGPSTIPRLLEEDMGTENFYYLLSDHQAEIEGLINTIHECELVAFEHLAAGPWDSITLIENTSTYYISPDVYKKYNMPHQRDFVNAIHSVGKPAILHMCGHVFNILDIIKETCCDGLHAITPPPTGDTPWEAALDVLGEDLIVIGCLDPSIFISGSISNIGPALDRLITPRIREANFVLAPFADGISVPLDRFETVKHWIENS